MDKCPKCGSIEIDQGELYVRGTARWNVGYVSHMKKGLYAKRGGLNSFVCVKCGYMETYFIDHKSLGKK